MDQPFKSPLIWLTLGLNSVAFSHTAINRPQIGHKRKREIEMDQFRERKRAEAHVSAPAAGQVNEHTRAAAVVAATVAATAQVKVHWRKRGLTETRAQSSQVENHCSISLKRLSRVYIEISAKVKEVTAHAKCKMVHGKDRNDPQTLHGKRKRVLTSMLTSIARLHK